MRLKIFQVITNCYFLSFLALCLGLLFGESKKMGKMRFGISGPLFAGIIIGWGVYALALSVQPGDPAYGVAQSLIRVNVVPENLEAFMLTLFIASVGLLASRDLSRVFKKYGIKFVVLGVSITSFGAVMSYAVCATLVPSGNAYEASGIYTGALTSSPGFGAALDSSKRHAAAKAGRYKELPREEQEEILSLIDPSGALSPENTPEITDEQTNRFSVAASSDVGMAYAVSYPFGLLSVILGMMMIPRLFRIDCAEQLRKHRAEMDGLRRKDPPEKTGGAEFDFKSFAFVCAVGYIVGLMEVRIGEIGIFSLGAPGGVFLSSIAFGVIGKMGPFNFRVSGSSVNSIKDISLGTYLGMVGLVYGYRVVQSLAGAGIFFAFASFAVGLSCVTVGFLIGHYIFRLNWILLSGAICGGMTSNPGLGVASNIIGSDDPAAGYAAAYPFSITGMVIFTVLMYAL